ncbi:hypothetical protein ABIC52_002515 [Curtobacterium oceanosedimentum]
MRRSFARRVHRFVQSSQAFLQRSHQGRPAQDQRLARGSPARGHREGWNIRRAPGFARCPFVLFVHDRLVSLLWRRP